MHHTENGVTQQSIQIPANQVAQIKQIPVTMLKQMFKVSARRSFPRSNADVCITDR